VTRVILLAATIAATLAVAIVASSAISRAAFDVTNPMMEF